MTSDFEVHSTSRYERLSTKLQKGRGATRLKNWRVLGVGEGQYRLSLGRWRFRYDIERHVVLLGYCGLRREDTY
jgi:hypothetical protein